MAEQLKEAMRLIPGINQPLTKAIIQRIVECCVFFETKNDHSQALNSPYLGVTPIYFTTTDTELLYSVFSVTKEELQEAISTADAISPEWKVVNDPYNHLVIYLSYRILTASSLTNEEKRIGVMTLFKLLHYKFFTSIVYNSYKFGADLDTMKAVMNSLSNKSDIVRYGTWKAVIEARSQDILSPESIHYKTLMTYGPDADIIYILSDTQSRLRQKIVLINQVYYELKASGDAVTGYSLVDTLDGEKILTSTDNVFDTMISGMLQQIQSPARFIDNELVHVLASRFKLSDEMLRQTLVMFCDLASVQASSKNYHTKVMISDPESTERKQVYAGCGLLLSEFIQKSYRYCILSKTNMSSKKEILIKVINAYTSSRINDEDILTIKRSAVYFVVKCGQSVRVATIAALSAALLVYILMRSFDYI